MFLSKSSGESYWSSYRLLENQLVRISHSISFDDNQMDVYSSELADIINTACVKIESLAKDIYDEHVWPFQKDRDEVPASYKKDPYKFNVEEWTRDKWYYDYNCLVEIDRKFSLSKKRICLKHHRFNFFKYGSTILPFGKISLGNCYGGKWEYSNRDLWKADMCKLVDVDWCKSYQHIKHNYIQSIPQHGTVKNAIMVMAAFYLLAIYNTCLPSHPINWDYRSGQYHFGFESELFECNCCNYTVPPFITDSDEVKHNEERKQTQRASQHKKIFEEQDLLNDTEGLPFLVILSRNAYEKTKGLVDEYCKTRNVASFDKAPYERKNDTTIDPAGLVLYQTIKRYIYAPYSINNICVAFNSGLNNVYHDYYMDCFDYEKSKHEKKRNEALSSLNVGDRVEVKYIFDDSATLGKVGKLTEYGIDLLVDVDGKERTRSDPKDNIIYIKKLI